MKKLLFTFFTLLLIGSSVNAQSDQTIFNRFNFRLTGAWGGTVAGASKVGDNFAPMGGGYGILEFDKQYLIGWGGYYIDDIVQFDADRLDYNLSYNGLIIGYTPQAYRVVHPRIMALIGSGRAIVNGRSDRTPVVRVEGGAEFNVFRWFRISANGGYRFLLDVETTPAGISSSDLSGIYGEVKFQFGWSWGRR